MKLHAAIRGFLLDWELHNHAASTLRLYRSDLGVFARWMAGEGVTDVEEVTIAHLRAFMLHTQQRPADAVNPLKRANTDGRKLATATLQAYVKVIKVLFHWLVATATTPSCPAKEEATTKRPTRTISPPPGHSGAVTCR